MITLVSDDYHIEIKEDICNGESCIVFEVYQPNGARLPVRTVVSPGLRGVIKAAQAVHEQIAWHYRDSLSKEQAA